MKITIQFFSAFVFLLTSFSVNAQFINKLKNAAERGVSRAIEKKVESEMEKIARRKLDKMFKDVYGTDDPSTIPTIDFEKLMSSIYNDIEVDDSYDFEGYSILEITGQDEKGKQNEPILLTSYFSINPEITGMKFTDPDKKEDGTYVLIYDFNRNAGITLLENEGEKMRMTFAYNYMEMSESVISEGIDDPKVEDVTFKKTGNSKTISGLECEEYLIETEENITHYWVTKTPITGRTPFWSQNNPFLTARMKDQNPDMFNNLPNGNMMEAHVVSKVDKSKIDMVTVELKENSKERFVMADYPSITQSMK
ncbi:DUF4412 domain-containing protein [Aquiflexum sp. LQ15W]|uniref:DUF4412 domain-containing protein n=1 Tax=Cognataquiflexum nitidum TaxID=2922272 RepID=UPI001F1335D6|nr:DUF4412 domain-containing protein [Cognataquiflexum nitidum]MCH6199176.1 DUF4412 domain-containing protein [Cognataquiflexum nitidum]